MPQALKPLCSIQMWSWEKFPYLRSKVFAIDAFKRFRGHGRVTSVKKDSFRREQQQRFSQTEVTEQSALTKHRKIVKSSYIINEEGAKANQAVPYTNCGYQASSPYWLLGSLLDPSFPTVWDFQMSSSSGSSSPGSGKDEEAIYCICRSTDVSRFMM